MLLNPGPEPVSFTLPPPAQAWIRELDSSAPTAAAPLNESEVTVQAQSLVLLAAAHIPEQAP